MYLNIVVDSLKIGSLNHSNEVLSPSQNQGQQQQQQQQQQKQKQRN